MKGSYVFDYIDENKFKKLERSLKKYNRLAYKKLYFEFYPELKAGNFLGEVKNNDEGKHMMTYELPLPTDSMFAKVHGEIVLRYHVYQGDGIIMLDTIMPEEILSEGHQSELGTYKGVMVSKNHAEKDIFKITLLNMIQK